MIRVHYEHETQALASEFLRALATDDATGVWQRLSRESRGLLEGRFAARSGRALQDVAGVDADGDERARQMALPLRDAALASLGGAEKVQRFGVSAARLVDRATAYVLLLPNFGPERIVAEEDWKPSHLIAFIRESGPGSDGSREWLVDLGRTAALSAEAGLPDPLGPIP